MYFAGNAALKTVANSGYVQSSTGLDVVWCDSASGGNLLPYELVANTYTPASGAGEWWVQVPTVYHSATTETIYAFVGKSGATDQSCGPSGANNCGSTLWNGYLGVFHGGTSSTLSVVNSTYGTTPTNHSTTAGAAGVNGGIQTGLSGYVDAGGTFASSSYTLETWASATLWSQASGCQILMANQNTAATAGTAWCYQNAAHILSMNICNGSGYSTAKFAFSPSNSTLYHLALQYNGSNASLATSYAGYLNGASQSMSMSATAATTQATPTTDFLIGEYAGGLQFSDLLVDELRVASSALSADWINADYLNQSSPTSFYGTFTGTGLSGGAVKHRSVIY
jgi:hypothetical protein